MSGYIKERVVSGRPLEDISVIDSHVHMGCFPSFNVTYNTEDHLIDMMNRLGIDKSLVSASVAIGTDYKYGNTLVIKANEKYPNRLLGYATLNPNYPDEMPDEINRCMQHSGIKGFKVHAAYHKSTIDSKGYQLVYEAADKKKCPVLIHTWGRADIAAVDRVADKFRDAHIIIGHAGADEAGMLDSVALVKKYNNVYIDTALSTPLQGNIEWFVNEIGSEKIIYGTDMPLFDPRLTLGRIALADICEEDKKNILGLNMSKLLTL